MDPRSFHLAFVVPLLMFGAATPEASAASLSAAVETQPVPTFEATSVTPPRPEDSTTGSAALAPSVAADPLAAESASLTASASATAEVAEDSTAAGTGAPIDDMTFVKRALESGRKEVAAARDAMPRLKRPELTRMAETLLRDHGEANSRLEALAKDKSWPVPAPRAPEPPPSGTASGGFEARWMAEMITGHERSVALYRSQAELGDDPELRQFARETLPTLEHHLKELRRLQK